MSMNSADYPPLMSVTIADQKKKCSPFKTREFYFHLIRCSFAEFLGTALYVFVGATSFSNFIGNEHPHLPTVALTFGFSFAGLSAAMQHVRYGLQH